MLAPRLLHHIHVPDPERCICPKKAPSCYDQDRAIGPCRSLFSIFFTLQACAFSATRQPQFCARTDEGRKKRTPKQKPRRQLQQRGPHRKAETPTGRCAVGWRWPVPRRCEAGCRSMSQRGDWALVVARQPVPDPARPAEASTDTTSPLCKRN